MGFALKEDGSAWNWGLNQYGQIGDNTATSKNSPVAVVGNHSFIEIRKIYYHCSALKADGSLWMWGENDNGKLGNGTVSHRSSPTLVVGNHSFISGSAGMEHSTGLKEDGSAWAWGLNTWGNLGNNTDANSYSSPVKVVGNHSFIQLVASRYNSYGLKADGSIWGWGQNDSGQIGNNTSGNSYSSPVAVVGNHSFIHISSNNIATFGRKADGSMWAWGFNGNGLLGDGSTTDRSSPVAVVGNHSFTETGALAFGLKVNGELWVWGGNTKGELGTGNKTSYSSPVKVVGSHSFKYATSNLIVTSFGLKEDGSLWGWGDNTYGDIGDGTEAFKSSPVAVVGNHSFYTLSRAPDYSITIADIEIREGTRWVGWCWGEQSPTPEDPVPWDYWEYKETGVDAPDTGSWGQLRLINAEEYVSDVKDMGVFSVGDGKRLLRYSYDDYSTGTGSGTVQIRGSLTSFNQEDDEVDGPSWEAFPVIGLNKNWRYVQIKVS